MAVKSETELYGPVKTMLEELGFAVKGEVRHCDIVAYKDGVKDPLIVELKRTFNLQLIFQLMDRLKLSDTVYAAVEYNPKKRVSAASTWNDAISLCRKLGVGLIGVQFYARKRPAVYILCEPGSGPPARRSPSGAKRLQQEFTKRSGDYNVGGSTGRKLITAYRERSLRIADQLIRSGPTSPKLLKAQLLDPGVAYILRDNVYGWFERIDRGVYGITHTGRHALVEFNFVLHADPESTM